MATIIFLAQKGGVGKSTLADEVAFSLERTQTPFSFFDLDPQGGTLHATAKNPDSQIAVVDTPGSLTPEAGKWIGAADAIVIPTRASRRDIAPLLRIVDVAKVRASGKAILIVLNFWNRYSVNRDFLEWLKQKFAAPQGYAGKLAIAALPQSEAILQASNAAKSVVAFAPRAQAAKSMMTIVNTVRKMAHLPFEQIDI